ncbi:MAG TPA: hypothetical protein VK989_15360 [Polyangia bacterium]|jgi:hypothetical protein|nr:hypothetical protein [Polyangia bacterium]
MAEFEVKRVHGRFEAESRELGVLISAVKLADAEETARRTAERAKKRAVFTYNLAPETRIERLLRWLKPRHFVSR